MATKKNTEDKPEKEAAPVRQNIPKAQMKKLFDAADVAQKDVDKANEAADKAKSKRSKAVQAIYEVLGAGPFNYSGRLLTITKRKKKDTDELTYYFKSPSKDDVLDI